MSGPETLKKLNFTSWLALYQYMVKMNQGDKPRVKVWPPHQELAFNEHPKPMELDMQEIKALAFDELMAAMPRPLALDLLRDTAQDLTTREREAGIILQFFNKLTRILYENNVLRL